jgi:hypothetical protein
MKQSLFTLLLLSAGFSVGTAKADFSVNDIHEAAKLATTEFETKNAGHAAHFVGYKVWKSKDESKVKIYVNHGGTNMEFDYMCHKHGTDIECHAQ